MKYQKYIIGVIILITISATVYFFQKRNVILSQEPEVSRVCYFYKQQNNSGLTDEAWFTYVKVDSEVQGLYYNLPAEKDSKFGPFTGTLVEKDNVKKIEGIWSAMAEGMENKEQFFVDIKNNLAQVLFGEMIEGEDGVYNYKEDGQKFPGFSMNKIDCNDLDDQVIVEKNIRANIKTITEKKPILGGEWYVTYTEIDTKNKIINVQFEDGHVKETDTFRYQRNGDSVNFTPVS